MLLLHLGDELLERLAGFAPASVGLLTLLCDRYQPTTFNLAVLAFALDPTPEAPGTSLQFSSRSSQSGWTCTNVLSLPKRTLH